MSTTTPPVNNQRKTKQSSSQPIREEPQGADLLLTLSAQIAQKQPEAIALLNQIYRDLFNENIQKGCGNCYQKAFFRIQKYLYLQQQNNPLNNQNIMTITNRKYLLKPDRVLQTAFGGDALTNNNLTDEAAEKLLEAHPALIKHFDRYPDAGLPVAGSELPVGDSQPANELSTKKMEPAEDKAE